MLLEFGSYAVACRQMISRTIGPPKYRSACVAKPCCAFDKRVENLLKVEFGAADNSENVGRRGLLLDRLGQLPLDRRDVGVGGGNAAARRRAARRPARLRRRPAPPRFHCFVCASTWTGSVNENTEPLPSSDSTQSLPPCSSTMRREIDRPRP